MIEKALDLVDNQGIPEASPEINQLEALCHEKSAMRYETQRDLCVQCTTIIAAIGLDAYHASRRIGDDSEKAKTTTGVEATEFIASASQSELDSTYGNSDRCKTPTDVKSLEANEAAAIEAREDLATFYGKMDIYDNELEVSDDEDDTKTVTGEKAIDAVALPSPQVPIFDSTDGGFDQVAKGKDEA